MLRHASFLVILSVKHCILHSMSNSFGKKRVVYYQLVVWFIKKIFCQFEKCSYFCNRFSEEKSAENDLLAQLV